MADVAIRQARHAGADFGPEAVTLGHWKARRQMALNSKVNGKTLRKLFEVTRGQAAASVESYFQVVDQEVQQGIVQGTSRGDRARDREGWHSARDYRR